MLIGLVLSKEKVFFFLLFTLSSHCPFIGDKCIHRVYFVAPFILVLSIYNPLAYQKKALCQHLQPCNAIMMLKQQEWRDLYNHSSEFYILFLIGFLIGNWMLHLNLLFSIIIIFWILQQKIINDHECTLFSNLVHLCCLKKQKHQHFAFIST